MSFRPRPTNAAVLREWIACSAISFSRSKSLVKRAAPPRRKQSAASARTSAIAGVEEHGPDEAVEAHELIEPGPVRVSVLDSDVGRGQAVGHEADRLHLDMGDRQRDAADLGVPDPPARPAEDAEADDDQNEAEDRVVVASDRAAESGRPGHTHRPPSVSALASSRMASRFSRIA